MGNVQQFGGTLAPLTQPGIKGLRAWAISEKSDTLAEDDAKKMAYLKDDPEQLAEWLKVVQQENYKNRPRGFVYLQALLKQGTAMDPSKMTPPELSTYRSGLSTALFGKGGEQGLLPPAGQPTPPSLAGGVQDKLRSLLKPTGIPEKRYRPGGLDKWGKGEEKEFFRSLGLGTPQTLDEAVQARLTGGEIKPVPKNYNDWVQGRETRFKDITTDKPLAGFLTMGPKVFGRGDIKGIADDLTYDYKELATDKDLMDAILEVPKELDKDGKETGDYDWAAWDNAAFEEKDWRVKREAYLRLITTLPDLDEKADEWIFFNWIGGGPGDVDAYTKPLGF
tara:strand:+ start:477 stop:1481 length:1005 start_codon:yes stop_codon:yes gene_type:complete